MEAKQSTKFLLHDLRNTLYQGLSCLDIARQENASLQGNPWIERSSQSIERCFELLATLSKLTEGTSVNPKIQDEFEKWHLQDYISEHAKPDLLALQSQYAIQVEVNCRLDAEPKYVYLHDQSIKRIKENVIQNAIHANSSKLVVNYQMYPRYYTVSFIDDGKGMSSEELERLLLKQFNQDDVHGLGTQFLMASAEEHNFVLTYASELEKGTTVKFLCPYALD